MTQRSKQEQMNVLEHILTLARQVRIAELEAARKADALIDAIHCEQRKVERIASWDIVVTDGSLNTTFVRRSSI
jgi:hypothetical protein